MKDRDLQSVHYRTSVISRSDTLVFWDTVFRDATLSLDTVVGDRWYRAGVRLEYPGKIVFSPEFRSERYVVTRLKKETVRPPKKCRLLRLFQKKHRVLYVDVVEGSPYVRDSVGRYVQIIR